MPVMFFPSFSASLLLLLFVALRCVVLRCVALRCIALLCFALLCFALHCVALRCVALCFFNFFCMFSFVMGVADE